MTPHSSLLTPHPLTHDPPPLTPHPSPLTPHPSPLTPHPSPLTPHLSPLTPKAGLAGLPKTGPGRPCTTSLVETLKRVHGAGGGLHEWGWKPGVGGGGEAQTLQGYLAHKKPKKCSSLQREALRAEVQTLQGYLAHKKQPPPRTLQ